MRIGILALQGAFIEHEKILEKLGVESFEIRQKKDIEGQMAVSYTHLNAMCIRI